MSEMNTPKKKTKKKGGLGIVAVVLAIILIGLLLALLLLTNAPKQTNLPPVEIPTLAQDEAEDAYGDVEVKTPYCSLFYSAKWKNNMRVEILSDEIECIVKFYGRAGDKEAYLFSVLFAAETKDSFPIGMYENEEGVGVDVSLEMSDFVPGKRWNEAEAEALCAMQEQINYIQEKLRQTPGFSE